MKPPIPPMPLTRRAQNRGRKFICGKRALLLGGRTLVMGILNCTPDSFSDGGEFFQDTGRSLKRIDEMARDGADIIDVGGESTRPGSTGVSAREEMECVIPVIREAARRIDLPISIDTSKSEVAQAAIENGASIVNDVTALKGDPRMARVVAGSGAGVILMHMKGEPRTMQENPLYEDLIGEIISGLRGSIGAALDSGISRDSIMIDPGIGFGKALRHNLEILKNLSAFKALGYPVAIGVSRKAFIGEILKKGVDGRLMGTASACSAAIMNGADVIRVHDTKEMSEVAKMTDAIMGKGI